MSRELTLGAAASEASPAADGRVLPPLVRAASHQALYEAHLASP